MRPPSAPGLTPACHAPDTAIDGPAGRALAVAGSALCLVATIAAAAASAVTAAPGWRVSHVFTGQPLANLLAVSATQPGDAWAFGDGKNGRPAAVHWNGRTWTISYLPHASDRPQQVSETGRTNVWAAGGGCGQVSTTPYVSRWYGRFWTTTLFPKAPCGASAVVTTGPSDGWLFNDEGGSSTAALHFNGRVWTRVSLGRVGTVISASAASRTNVWAVTFTPQNKMLVVHWNGSSWRTVATPAAPVRRGDHAVPIQFVAAGANNLWLTTNIVDNKGVLPGQSLVLPRDGSGWHWIRVPFSDQALNAAPDGHGGLWRTP
jgi:hypothetical protein